MHRKNFLLKIFRLINSFENSTRRYLEWNSLRNSSSRKESESKLILRKIRCGPDVGWGTERWRGDMTRGRRDTWRNWFPQKNSEKPPIHTIQGTWPSYWVSISSRSLQKSSFFFKILVFVDFFFVKSLFWAISGTIYAWRGSFITILDRVKTQWHQFCSRFGLGVSLLAADSKHLRLKALSLTSTRRLNH